MECLRTIRDIRKALRRKKGYFLCNVTMEDKTNAEVFQAGGLLIITKPESDIILETSYKIGIAQKIDGEIIKLDFDNNEAKKLYEEFSKQESIDEKLLMFLSKGAFRFMLPMTLQYLFGR